MNKVLSVVAVVAILGVSFYAGHKSFGSSLEYEHADVLDVAASCKKGEFIGDCKACKKCGMTKYSAGGCSYFKDTFCTLCNKVAHCQQQNTFCTTKDDHYCVKCDDGYFGPQCEPCKQCSNEEFVKTPCISVRENRGNERLHFKKGKANWDYDRNTVCQKCDRCEMSPKGDQKKRSFLTRPCDVGGNGVTGKNKNKIAQVTVKPGVVQSRPGDGAYKNSVCTPCRECKNGFEWTKRTCESPEKLGVSGAAALQWLKGNKKPRNTMCQRCVGCMSPEHPKYKKDNGRMYALSMCEDTKDANGLFKTDGYAKCAKCTQCSAGHYISKPCTPGHPHLAWMCENIKTRKIEKCPVKFVKGSPAPKPKAGWIVVKDAEQPKKMLGTDAKCAECTPRPAGSWTVFPCSASHTSDAVHQKCSKCTGGEYEFAKCTAFSDTICPSCPSAREKLFANDANFKSGLKYCSVSAETGLPHTFCTSTTNKNGVVVPRSTKCGRWDTTGITTKFTWPDGTRHTLPYDQDHCLPDTRGDSPKYNKCGKWVSNCQEGFFGQSCCYHKHPYSCGTETSRQRSARRMKFPKSGRTLNDLAEFCMSICDEFPDCLAVEIQDGGDFSDPAKNGKVVNDKLYEQTCFFKSAFSQDQKFRWKSQYKDNEDQLREGDPALDCYSNTCRQNIYRTLAGARTKVINYKPKESKTFLQVLDEKTSAQCAKKCSDMHFKGKGVIGSKYNRCFSKCRTTWNKIEKAVAAEKCSKGKCAKFNAADKKAQCMGKCQIDWINKAVPSKIYRLDAVPSAFMATATKFEGSFKVLLKQLKAEK